MLSRTKLPPGQFHAPTFRALATVSVFKTGSTSHRPDAQLRVEFYLNNRDHEHSAAKRAAQWCLEQIGTPQAAYEGATYEHSIDRYIALDSRGVRNPDNEPVDATAFPGHKEMERLVRQRRVVPDSHADMVRLYGPKPAAGTATTDPNGLPPVGTPGYGEALIALGQRGSES